MTLPKEWEFLFATRFWAGVILSASITLADPGFPTQPWYVTLSKFLALVAGQFMTVKTIDKFGEQKVLAAAVSTGEVSAEDATNIPPTK